MDLPPSPIFLLHDTARLLRRRVEQRKGDIPLTRSQWQLLAYLARNEGITQAGLADLLDVEPITVCRMEEAGWVVRASDPKDRRVRRLFMTDKAVRHFEAMKSQVAEIYDDAFSMLTAQERNTLLELLERLRNGLSARGDAANEISHQAYQEAK